MNESLKEVLAWYEDRIPESVSLLHEWIGKRIGGIVCHHFPGQDGRLFDTIEIDVHDKRFFLRPPREERIARCFPSFKHFPVTEFVTRSSSLDEWREHPAYQRVSDRNVESWQSLVGKRISRIDLLLKLSPLDIQGIRIILDDDSIINYHFAWGDTPGALVSAKVGLVIGELKVPSNINWTYVPWIWDSHVDAESLAATDG